MFTLETPDCPICETNNYDTVIETYSKRDNDFLSPNQHLSICKTCALVSLNPRQPQEVYNRFYSSRNTSKLESMKPEELKNSQGTRDIYRLFFTKNVKAKYPEVKRVLDVGAGLGLFASYLKDDGFDVEILEPSESAVNYARKNFQLKGYVDFIETVKVDEKFDALTMTALIEHLLSPKIALAAMKELLKPNGIIYICTPDILECVPCVSLNSTFTFQHVYSFTENSLRALLAREGFDVEVCYRDPAVAVGANPIYPGNFINGRLHVIARSSTKKSVEETRGLWQDYKKIKNEILKRVDESTFVRFFATRKKVQRLLQKTIGRIIRPVKPMDIRLQNFTKKFGA